MKIINEFKANKIWFFVLLLAIVALFNLLAFNSIIGALGGWITAVATMLFWHNTRFWRGFLVIFLVSWLSISIAWVGATPLFGVAHYLFMGVNTLIGLVPFALDRWLTPRTTTPAGRPFLSTLIFPTALVAVEYLGLFGSPLGTFGASGYGQIIFPWLTQMVAVTGLLGITFVTGWFASTIVWAWEQRQAPQLVGRGVAIYLAFLFVIIGYGVIRLATDRAQLTADDLTIASFTAATWDAQTLFPKLDNDLAAFRTETQAAHNAYLSQTAVEADNGAQIVLWPEGAIVGVSEDVQNTVQQAQSLAQEKGIYLGAPIFEFYPGSDRVPENRLLVIDPQGEIVLNHVKFGGNFMEGTLLGDQNLTTVETPFGSLSGVICWDADFPAVMRQAGQAEVDILLVPARDWAEITPMHGEMATFRGIENGLTIIRQADQGLSLISDPYGRVLAESNHFDPGGQTMRATVDIRSTATPYTQGGDWLGVAAVVGTILLSGWALRQGRRPREVVTPSN